MANAAALTGQSPSTTSPSWLTRIRSVTRICLKFIAERVDPEVVEPLGVARGDVAGDALVEAELAEQAEGGGEALLAVPPLLVDGRERGQRVGLAIGRHGPDLRGEWSSKSTAHLAWLTDRQDSVTADPRTDGGHGAGRAAERVGR